MYLLNTMKKYSFVLFIIVLVVVAGFLLTKSYQGNGVETTSNPVQAAADNPTAKNLFSQSPDYASAAQIFPGALSDKAKLYIENYDMKTQTASDGVTQITLTPKEKGEGIQTYQIKSGQTLYFIEKYPGDDTKEVDKNLKDDYGVIVDAQGYIIP
jgi:hypothetical protein